MDNPTFSLNPWHDIQKNPWFSSPVMLSTRLFGHTLEYYITAVLFVSWHVEPGVLRSLSTKVLYTTQ